MILSIDIINAQSLNFMGIPLGIKETEFIKQLEGKGFKLSSSSGMYEGVFTGKDVMLFCNSTPKSRIVYEIKLYYLDDSYYVYDPNEQYNEYTLLKDGEDLLDDEVLCAHDMLYYVADQISEKYGENNPALGGFWWNVNDDRIYLVRRRIESFIFLELSYINIKAQEKVIKEYNEDY